MMIKIDKRLLNGLLFMLSLHLLNNYLDVYSGSGKRVVILHFLAAISGITLIHYAMARAAQRLVPGDNSTTLRSRLSINPFKHIDFPGFLVTLLCGVGSARAVDVDWRQSANPRKSMFLVHATGLFTAAASAMLFSVCLFLAAQSGFTGRLLTFFAILTLVFLKLLALYLLPIPPLPGGYLLLSVLPRKLIARVFQWEKYGAWVLVVLAVLALLQPWIINVTRIIFENLPPVVSLVDMERLGGMLR